MRVRIAIEVMAGVIPGKPMDEYKKQFFIPSEVWYAEGEWAAKPDEAAAECKRIQQEAADYMMGLWNPAYVNWVRCDWIYF